MWTGRPRVESALDLSSYKQISKAKDAIERLETLNDRRSSRRSTFHTGTPTFPFITRTPLPNISTWHGRPKVHRTSTQNPNHIDLRASTDSGNKDTVTVDNSKADIACRTNITKITIPTTNAKYPIDRAIWHLITQLGTPSKAHTITGKGRITTLIRYEISRDAPIRRMARIVTRRIPNQEGKQARNIKNSETNDAEDKEDGTAPHLKGVAPRNPRLTAQSGFRPGCGNRMFSILPIGRRLGGRTGWSGVIPIGDWNILLIWMESHSISWFSFCRKVRSSGTSFGLIAS